MVQGVGFRPFVYQLATQMGLTGTVHNGTEGVDIDLCVTPAVLEQFLHALENELPPLASITHIETALSRPQHFDDFCILSSDAEGEHTVGIPPDVAVCTECEKELFDPANRRFGYPFITCTHCGVRYSIIYDLPYDRKNTSMKFFQMCDACEKEYTDPLDRRYHAQPIGCWECGPALSLLDSVGVPLVGTQKALIEKTVQLLSEGKILAVKGVGGYHLMCVATNEAAVATLRKRKRRPSKPFAVMVKDVEMARTLADIGEQEEAMLRSKERPVVLLNAQRSTLSAYVSPGLTRIGLFLPYTPLHLLLLHRLDRPLVATSANMTDEPICTDRESLERLEGVYDCILDHDRQIVNGVDDSVVMMVKGQALLLRRARGYAPVSVKPPFSLPKRVLAMGANQKSTVAIGFDDQVILSPHIGDLDSIASVAYYKKNVETLERIYDFKPEVIVHDKHPNYESTKLALSLSAQRSALNAISVQHHYAHILGVMAEKGMQGKVFGVAFDGTGYGDDGRLWGGEFLVCDYESYERVAHLAYFKLLGGAKAIKEPRRVALSLLFDIYGERVLEMKNPTTRAFSMSELKTYFIAWKKGLNAPLSSSVGRFFDAVASLLGICQQMSFEGESGMLLEEYYDASVRGHYGFGYNEGIIDIRPTVEEMLQEIDRAAAVSKFFHTLVEMIAMVYQEHQDLPLVLSGGVFQNRVLLALLLECFPDAVIPNRFPPNDGGIALGQAVASGRD